MSEAPAVDDATRSSAPPGLFDGVLARGPVASTVDDGAWLRAMLTVEAALARAQSAAGVLPPEAGPAVTEHCATVRVDIAALGERAAASGNPVVPLVEALRRAAPFFPGWIHHAATSQDILDTASMLVARGALDALRPDLLAAADAAATLAARHRDTPMAGRTLMQLAVPTTFGLKAAGWMVGLDAAAARLAAVRSGLPVQFGGAAGTRAGLAGHGAEVARRLADEVGLADPGLPWHTVRTPIADLASALGITAGVVAKAARDIVLLAQNEVAEVSEGAPGGSSAMAHKRNPTAAVSALAGAAQAPGLVATLLASMGHEHERAAGAWHAEWRPLRELLVSTGSAVAWLRAGLERLVIHPEAMRRTLDSLIAETGVADDVGEAPDLVDEALARHGVGSPS